jgi:ammonia channel protein AmtB
MGRAKGTLHSFVKGLTALAVGTLVGFVGQHWESAVLCGIVALLATLGLGDRITLSAAAIIAVAVGVAHRLLTIFDQLVSASIDTTVPAFPLAFKPVLSWLSSYWQPDHAFIWSVHTLAGGAALGALMASGPRVGRYNRNGLPAAMPAHNLPIAAVGVFLIWFGSQAFSQSLWELTTLSGFVALLTSLAWTKWRFGKVDPSFAITAFWTGLVSGFLLGESSPVVLALSGIFGGIVSVSISLLLDKNFVDDIVGIVPAEGVAPLIGLTVLWVVGGASLGLGFVNWVVAFFLGFASTWLVCRVLASLNLLRLHPMDELEGADLRLYGIAAYPEFEMREA